MANKENPTEDYFALLKEEINARRPRRSQADGRKVFSFQEHEKSSRVLLPLEMDISRKEKCSRGLRRLKRMCGLIAVESNICARVRLSCRARSDTLDGKENVEVLSRMKLPSHTRTRAFGCARC